MSDVRAEARKVFEMHYEWGRAAEACNWQAVGEKALAAWRFRFRMPPKSGEEEGTLAYGVVFTSTVDQPHDNDQHMTEEVARLGGEHQAEYIGRILAPDLPYLLGAANTGEISMNVVGAAAREDVPLTQVMARGIDGTY